MIPFKISMVGASRDAVRSPRSPQQRARPLASAAAATRERRRRPAAAWPGAAPRRSGSDRGDEERPSDASEEVAVVAKRRGVKFLTLAQMRLSTLYRHCYIARHAHSHELRRPHPKSQRVCRNFGRFFAQFPIKWRTAEVWVVKPWAHVPFRFPAPAS